MVRSMRKHPWDGPDPFPHCTEGKLRLGKEKGLSQLRMAPALVFSHQLRLRVLHPHCSAEFST